MRPTRRERRLRQKYEQPGDFVVFMSGLKSLSLKLFYFMFSWYFFISDSLERRRERRKESNDEIESFDSLMDSASSQTNDDHNRFSQIASQMRGDDSDMEREIYIEFRFREIVMMILSIALMLGVCGAIAGAIVGIGSIIFSLIP